MPVRQSSLTEIFLQNFQSFCFFRLSELRRFPLNFVFKSMRWAAMANVEKSGISFRIFNHTIDPLYYLIKARNLLFFAERGF